MSGRKIRTEEEARTYLEAARSSGNTRADWARMQGIDARSLNAWRLNLARKDGATRTTEFAELVPTARATADSAGPSTLHVRRGDLVIDVSGDFDDEHLLRVLRVVARC